MDIKMNKKVILLGNKLGVLEKLQEMHKDIIYVRRSGSELQNVINYHLPFEKTDKVESLKEFLSFANKYEIQGIVVCNEMYVELAAYLKDNLDNGNELRGVNFNTAKELRDKPSFKDKVKESNISTTNYMNFPESDYWENIKKEFNTPFLVKPRKGFVAQGIEVISNETEFYKWLSKQDADKVSSKFYIEEMLTDFKEYCCDTMMYNGEVIAQFPGEYSISCLDSSKTHSGIGVSYPGYVSKEKLTELRELTNKIIDLFGIKDGFCHVEFFLHDNEWKVSELGYRLAGGYQLPTESTIIKHDLVQTYIDIFLNNEVSLTFTNTDELYYGYFLFAKKEGKISKITSDFNKGWVIDSNITVKEGEVLSFEDSSVTNAGHVIFKANNIEDLKTQQETSSSLLKIDYN
jgi:biotin carboxylase